MDTTQSQQNPSPVPLGSGDNTKATIVIIGAGSIGLSTAYHLALHQASHNNDERIIVLDALPKPFGATSGPCTGCLHYEFREPEGGHLIELGRYSFELWRSLAADGEGFREAPNRLGGRMGRCFDAQAPLVNPKGVGTWLSSECLRLGVDIRLSATATAVELCQGNLIRAVVHEEGGAIPKRLDCQALVVAAGPWTPSVYQALFPSSAIKLRSDLHAGDWILLCNPLPVSQKSLAFIALDDIVGEKSEFTGRNDGTIWITGRKDHKSATLKCFHRWVNPQIQMRL
ncbi:hypothetical protein VPNG_10198 [Cytospora leucostoma]|uniref:FAD-dependent oxidoreductase domain-containing protein 1 n=1 Tax=Cytospora leucostoma TaxID=1230097 RepID=A0A423VD96_9PEZI|nr:hypothetical protein VPNG_10198 [Cytospora leucostoma]